LDFPVTVDADASARVMALPDIEGLSTTYFLKLTLLEGASVVSCNWYWLSRRDETSDFRRTDWDYTPVTQFNDFTDLARLAPAIVTATVLPSLEPGRLQVEIRNVSPVIAFFLRLKLTRGERGDLLLPALWQDNYVSLTPGEKRNLTVEYDVDATSEGAPLSVEIDGWNVERTLANAG
jgi:exo-1,4-beta-D-glucosaminidase